MTAVRRLRAPRRARRGQTLVIVALLNVVLLGGLGLVIDAGYDYGQRRTMQNAADAAAMAGAREVLANASTGAAVQARVNAVAAQNGADTSRLSCNYIDNATPPAIGADCSQPSTGSSGVRVRTTEQHGTFFMRALGIGSSGTGAQATAQVRTVTGGPSAPFLPCGIAPVLATGSTGSHPVWMTTPSAATPPATAVPPTVQNIILYDGAGQPYVNEAAYSYDYPSNWPPTSATPTGPAFVIHGPQIPDCGANSDDCKGLNITPGEITPGEILHCDSGNHSGPVLAGDYGPFQDNLGPLGCHIRQTYDCVMILPVVDDSGPGGNGSHIYYNTALLAAFWVTLGPDTANEHTGRLIKNYPIVAPSSSSGWTAGYNGSVTIRLIK